MSGVKAVVGVGVSPPRCGSRRGGVRAVCQLKLGVAQCLLDRVDLGLGEVLGAELVGMDRACLDVTVEGLPLGSDDGAGVDELLDGDAKRLGDCLCGAGHFHRWFCGWGARAGDRCDGGKCAERGKRGECARGRVAEPGIPDVVKVHRWVSSRLGGGGLRRVDGARVAREAEIKLKRRGSSADLQAGWGTIADAMGEPIGRVVVIEDEQPVRDAVLAALVAERFAATGFDDVPRLGAVLALMPDLAILDVRLPGGNGFEWARSLRQQRELPIIFSPPATLSPTGSPDWSWAPTIT